MNAQERAIRVADKFFNKFVGAVARRRLIEEIEQEIRAAEVEAGVKAAVQTSDKRGDDG